MNYLVFKSQQFRKKLYTTISSYKNYYQFSSYPIDIAVQKSIQFQFKFRTIVNLEELAEYIQQNKQSIKKYGTTTLLQAFNEFPMQSFRRERDQINPQRMNQKIQFRIKLYHFFNELTNLNFYQENLRYSIVKKFVLYQPKSKTAQTQAFIQKYQNSLISQLIKPQPKIDVIDALNWIYMLPMNYQQHQSVAAFQIIQKQLDKKSSRQYLQNQRCIPVLVKRIYETDWIFMRKYKNILKFITFNATIRQFDNIEELIIMLERIVKLGLHQVGYKCIPQIIDSGLYKCQKQFESISKNKQLVMKIFSLWKYLPLNFNKPFFNKIHNFLKISKDLSSHLLLFIPYNKLSEKQIEFLQSKLFSLGREDIILKLIYTIYQSDFKYIMTPFLTKEAYYNFFQIWKKQGTTSQYYIQFYVAMIYRFLQMKNPSVKVDKGKLKSIFRQIHDQIERKKYYPLKTFAFPAYLCYIELCSICDIQRSYFDKLMMLYSYRKKTNSMALMIQNIFTALRPFYNSQSKDNKKFITFVIKQLIQSPQLLSKHKCQLVFLIQKSRQPSNQLKQISSKLCDELFNQPQMFAQTYVNYPSTTLKLTNFVYAQFAKRSVNFSVVVEVTSGLNLKLLTSLKGKLLTPLKKYIKQLDPSRFNIQDINISSLFLTYLKLFYFRCQIQQFMDFFSVKLIDKIMKMEENQQFINGHSFINLCSYLMEAIKHFKPNQKAEIIQKILKVIKNHRKKQGLYLKVAQFNFICTNKKYLKINNEVLQLQFSQILSTLKKTQKVKQFKEIYFVILKFHCLQFIQLTATDLKYFRSLVSTFVDSSLINLTKIKQILGYQILNCQDEGQIQKIKLILCDIIKLAFRKQANKVNFFVYQYFLMLFSKIQQKQLVIQICQNVLYNRLYPIEVSTLVPILSKNQIKSRRFTERVVQIMILADAYTSYQKLQVISWLQKIYYQLPTKMVNVNQLKSKVKSQIQARIIQTQHNIRKTIQTQQRSIQDGFQIKDISQFKSNFKLFIEYAWNSIKNKQTKSNFFKFICRYFFIQIQLIKEMLQNPQQGKNISKTKLFHILKYMKDSGYFNYKLKYSQSEKQENIRQAKSQQEKQKKYKLLLKLEQKLDCFKIEKCQKLQQVLESYKQKIQWTFKPKIKFNNGTVQVEYLIKEKNKSGFQEEYVIHTVKSYHQAAQIQTKQVITQKNTDKSQKSTKKDLQNPNSSIPNSLLESLNQSTENGSKNLTPYKESFMNPDEQVIGQTQLQQYFKMQEADLSHNLKVQTNVTWNSNRKSENRSQNQNKEKNKKPLFGAAKLAAAGLSTQSQALKPVSDANQAIRGSKFEIGLTCALPLQLNAEQYYKNYNGYLKIQKSLIQLSTNKKCVIYDPKLNIFFV